MRSIPLLVPALAALALLAGPARAQDVPADQSCGGLLCDVGVLGHKVAPPPAPAPAAPVVVPAPPPPVAQAPALKAPAPETPRRKSRVAHKASRPVAASAATPRRIAPAAPPAAPVAADTPPPAAPPAPRIGPTFTFQSVDPRFQLGE